MAEYEANLDLPNKKGSTPALIAAQNGRIHCLRLLAEHKANLDLPNQNGSTAAHKSAQQGHSDCLCLLADYQANLEVTNNNGDTPLGLAVYKSKVDTVQLLVTHGVAVNPPPNKFGDTPLSDAKANGHSAIVEILLAAGAK